MASHILERLKQRYGLDLTLIEVRAWQRHIESGKAVLLRRDPATVSERYLVSHAGIQLVLIYSTDARRIVTVLPHKSTSSKQVTAGPGRGYRSKRNARQTRYIPEIDLEDDAA